MCSLLAAWATWSPSPFVAGAAAGAGVAGYPATRPMIVEKNTGVKKMPNNVTWPWPAEAGRCAARPVARLALWTGAAFGPSSLAV